MKNELIECIGQGRTNPRHFIRSEGEVFSQLFALKMTGHTFPNNIEKICKSLGM